MLFADLISLKTMLEIPLGNTAEDKKLWFLIEIATSWIEQLLNRPNITLAYRTEYYAGTGTQKLLLRHRPVYQSPTIEVTIDWAGYYGESSGAFQNPDPVLQYGIDFALDIKEEGGLSESGILIRANTLWPKPAARQQGLLSAFMVEGYGNVRVKYTGGWSVDTLPADLRWACMLLVARMRYIMPLGMETTSENYEDRSIGIVGDRKDFILAPIKAIIFNYRNWRW